MNRSIIKKVSKFLTITLVCMLFLQHGQAQVTQICAENFDGSFPPAGWTVSHSGVGGWNSNTLYYLPTSGQSCWGDIPLNAGDSIVLTTDAYNLSLYEHVLLKFSHICKVATTDIARIEYKINNTSWASIPSSFYLGSATNYYGSGFNAASYSEWKAGNNAVIPNQSWWKEELFDMTALVGFDPSVQFRFIIKSGAVSNVSYGWLLDNFQIIASPNEFYSPTVEFISPLVKDTVYTPASTVSKEINAKIKTNTSSPILPPYLRWTANNGLTYDSTIMNMVAGDSLWRAMIPQLPVGATVTYQITGKDNNGNAASAYSGYFIAQLGSNINLIPENFLFLGLRDTLSTTVGYVVANNANSWSRSLYLNGELTYHDKIKHDPTKPELINSIAYRTTAGTPVTRTEVLIYMKCTTMTAMPTTSPGTTFADPVTDGATLVYKGPINASASFPDWIQLQFTEGNKLFQLNPGQNLLVYVLENSGAALGAISWRGELESGITNFTRYGTARVHNSSAGSAGRRPITRFGLAENCEENSVKLVNILSPNNYFIPAGQDMPIKVTIHNRGSDNLDSCQIHWTLNGIPQPTYTYKRGGLPWDFKDTVTIGQFLPTQFLTDEIAVWVAMPNGAQDPVKIDDTLRTTTFAGVGPLSGDCVIGSGGIFPSMHEAIQYLNFYKANGDIRFLLKSGTYTDQKWDLSNYTSIMGNHNLSITSQAGHKDSVILLQTGASGTNILTLGINNFTLEALTLNSRPTANCVVFTAACTNIVVNNCNLFTNTTSVGAGGGQGMQITKAANTGTLDNFRLTNCWIDGGGAGYSISLIGNNATSTALGQFNTNITMDSNLFTNASDDGLFARTTHFLSISHNTFISRTTADIYQGYNGIRLFGPCNAERIVGNRIVAQNSRFTTGNGIQLGNLNQLQVTDPKPTLIANNEIIMQMGGGTNATRGINFNYEASQAKASPIYLLHNSIYVTTTSSSAQVHGINFVNVPDSTLHIVKNNMIHVANSSNAYPVYLGTAFNTGIYDIDSNNYYGTVSLGYINGQGDMLSLTAWQNVVTTDKASKNILPNYIAPTATLELNDYSDFISPLNPKVPEDIRGTTRMNTTNWGCYTYVPSPGDAALLNIFGLKSNGQAFPGDKDTIKVELFNAGEYAITSATIGWSINGVPQPNIIWTGNIAMGSNEIITLGELTYILGENAVEVHICDLGSLIDFNNSNDTIMSSTYVCSAPLSGTYTIGASGQSNYVSFTAFVDALDKCGATGTLTLEFIGKNDGPLDLNSLGAKLNNIPLTITGGTGNDMISYSGNTITIGVINRNITIKDIAIKSDTGHCIYIIGACTNLLIRNCDILADTLARTARSYGIYKVESTGRWDSVFIVGNRLVGGYRNAVLNGGVSGYSDLMDNIVFDSNSCTHAFYGGISAQNTHVRISDNKIIHRPAGTGAASSEWSAIDLSATNGDVTGNHIFYSMQNTGAGLANSRAINLGGIARSQSVYIANNEIYLGDNPLNGIYFNSGGDTSRKAILHIVHNSIYGGRNNSNGISGIGIYNNTCITIKHNDIYTTGTSTTPINLSYSNDFTWALSNNNLLVDANNMYSTNGRVGITGPFTGQQTAHTSISSWQNSVPTDTKSTAICPGYIDVNNSLKWLNYTPISSSPFPGIITDKDGNTRKAISTWGCYTPVADANVDLTNNGIINMPTTMVLNQKNPIDVRIIVSGDSLVREATFGWSAGGTIQKKTIYFNPPLNTFEIVELTIDTLIAQYSMSNLMVWVDLVNGQKDDNINNDTARIAVPTIVPLAEFVAPFIADTIYNTMFNVYATIFEATGATNTIPQLYVHSIVNGIDKYDTIPMTRNANEWMATIQSQYFNSKVIYSLSVSDMIGNNITLIDSTYIALRPGEVEFDLSISDAISPINRPDILCISGDLPLRVAVENVGRNDYDFVVNPLNISVHVINPHGHDTTYTKIISSGGLLSGITDTFEIESTIPLMYAKNYEITMFINIPLDTVSHNDTFSYIYTSGRAGLPIDEFFSEATLPLAFVSVPATSAWLPYQPDGSFSVQPDFGTGILRFAGTTGDVAIISTRQLDMYRVSNPILEFWYYHDTTTDILDNSFIQIRAIADGVSHSIFTASKRDNTYGHGWKNYALPLNNFTNAQCLLIEFEAVNRNLAAGGKSEQYIDRIYITSDLDAAISEIIISPEADLCDEGIRNVDVVIQTMTSQSFDFSATPVEIELDVLGTKHRFQIPGKRLEGYTPDTLRVATGIKIPAGIYPIKAYFAQSIDDMPANDTAVYNLNFNPQFRIELQQMTDIQSFQRCIYPETSVSQNIKIENIGTVELSNIVMILDIEDVSVTPSSHFIIRDTLNVSIPVGHTENYSFKKAYLVPFGDIYNVGVTAYLGCDSALLHGTHAISECIDVNDIAIIALVNPQKGAKDVQGQSVNIEVSLKNFEIAKDWEEVDITAVISSETQGIVRTFSLYGNLNLVGVEDTVYRFNDAYIVPDEEQYSIMVFISKQDEYQHNDTLIERRETTKPPTIRGIHTSNILLGQNIPNPANNNTIIKYSVPQDGEVNFKIYSVSGQILYNNVENVQSGDHQIEINTTGFAAGIYFYTMEFEGQRITRRMSKQ